jgi:hypothetical protein
MSSAAAIHAPGVRRHLELLCPGCTDTIPRRNRRQGLCSPPAHSPPASQALRGETRCAQSESESAAPCEALRHTLLHGPQRLPCDFCVFRVFRVFRGPAKPPAHFPLPTSHFPLLTSHFPLPTSHFPLPTSHFSPPSVESGKSGGLVAFSSAAGETCRVLLSRSSFNRN